jgi:hypothetical protein
MPQRERKMQKGISMLRARREERREGWIIAGVGMGLVGFADEKGRGY